MADKAGNGPALVDPYTELTSSFHTLLTTGKYSDLTIICGSDQYLVHKAILCPRSTFFAACTGGRFKEGYDGVITLQDDDPQAVKLMIHYFYHLDYPEKLGAERPSQSEQSESSEPQNLTLHAKVYALAEKYVIEGLRTVALGKFKEGAKVHWHTNDFLQAAEEVYMSTMSQDRGLRDVVVDTIVDHLELLDRDNIQDVVKRLDLCFDLMMRLKGQRVKRPPNPIHRLLR